MTNLYLDDKIHKHTPDNDCLSDCCEAPTNSDIMICGECKEHCGIYYETDTEPRDEYNQNNNQKE